MKIHIKRILEECQKKYNIPEGLPIEMSIFYAPADESKGWDVPYMIIKCNGNSHEVAQEPYYLECDSDRYTLKDIVGFDSENPFYGEIKEVKIFDNLDNLKP